MTANLEKKLQSTIRGWRQGGKMVGEEAVGEESHYQRENRGLHQIEIWQNWFHAKAI